MVRSGHLYLRLLFCICMAMVLTLPQNLYSGLLDKVKSSVKKTKFLWNERKPIEKHVKHVTRAYGKLIKEKDIYLRFSVNILNVYDSVDSIIKSRANGFNNFNPSKIRNAISSIDYLANNFTGVVNKAVKLYKEFRPDIEYFVGAEKKMSAIGSSGGGSTDTVVEEAQDNPYFEPGVDIPVSYDGNSADELIKNDIFREESLDRFASSLGIIGSIKYILKKPLNIFRFKGIGEAYDRKELGGRLGFRCASMIESTAVRVLKIKKQIKELLDVKKLLSNLLPSLVGGDNALLKMRSSLNSIKGVAQSIVSSLKRNSARVKEAFKAYSDRFGNPLDEYRDEYLDDGYQGGGFMDDYELPVVGDAIPVEDAPQISLQEAHEKYNYYFKAYRKLVRSGAPKSKTAPILKELHKAKSVYMGLLRKN